MRSVDLERVRSIEGTRGELESLNGGETRAASSMTDQAQPALNPRPNSICQCREHRTMAAGLRQ